MIYLSALVTLRVDALYKSTTFTFVYLYSIQGHILDIEMPRILSNHFFAR